MPETSGVVGLIGFHDCEPVQAIDLVASQQGKSCVRGSSTLPGAAQSEAVRNRQ